MIETSDSVLVVQDAEVISILKDIRRYAAMVMFFSAIVAGLVAGRLY